MERHCPALEIVKSVHTFIQTKKQTAAPVRAILWFCEVTGLIQVILGKGGRTNCTHSYLNDKRWMKMDGYYSSIPSVTCKCLIYRVLLKTGFSSWAVWLIYSSERRHRLVWLILKSRLRTASAEVMVQLLPSVSLLFCLAVETYTVSFITGGNLSGLI